MSFRQSAAISLNVLLFLSFASVSGEETDNATARKTIQKVLDDQVVAWNKGDLDGFMQGYWNDPKLSFYSGKDKTYGWEATLKRYQKRYQADGKEMGQLTFSELEIQLLGKNHAVVKGRWELTLKKAEEKPSGLFSVILEKKKEVWKIIHDHTSN